MTQKQLLREVYDEFRREERANGDRSRWVLTRTGDTIFYEQDSGRIRRRRVAGWPDEWPRITPADAPCIV